MDTRNPKGPRIAVNPVTLEVIRHAIVSITDQIDANITRTAFSPYIYEYRDFAVGITDENGRLIAQSTGGMPVFVADSVGMAVRDGLEIYGRERIHRGDVIVCNHAAVQGQHLNNTVMYTPIFAGAEGATLVGFFAINVHWIDIGGAAVGSITFRTTDIFMEGLQLRTVKLWSKGEPVEEVYRIIENNTRFPAELMGDIAAQLGGCVLGRALTAKLVDKYGVDTFQSAVDVILDQSEAAARAKIKAIPDGTYEAEAFLDNDGVNEARIPIRVKVIIAGDEMTVDYSEMADQVSSCINSGRYGGGQTTARVAFKYLIAADERANEGTYRPLKLNLPDGKILSASPTAAMGLYPIPFPTVIDAIIKALEPAMPDRVTGAHFGTYSSFRILGKVKNGAIFNANDSGHGGWGACSSHDGAGPFRTMAHGDTRIIPVELQEALYPFRIDEFKLREDSAGAGKFRGGMGISKKYTVLAPCVLWANFDRIECPPWGICGGKPALAGRVSVLKKGSDKPDVFYKAEGYDLDVGDTIFVETGGGGGYGAPEQRASDLLLRDLRRGYISLEAAARDYGISAGSDGLLRRHGDVLGPAP
jgi:N-methylhydantoinase B